MSQNTLAPRTPPYAGSSPKRLRYLSARHRGQPFDYPIQAIQRALNLHGIADSQNDHILIHAIGTMFRKLGLIRNIAYASSSAYLVPIMQISEHRLFPQCYWAEMIPYCFDCWEPKFERWEAFFKKHRTRVAFFTARQSAEYMGKHVQGLDAVWMPEGIDLTLYSPEKPVSARSIDVLELGRRWDVYHEAIREHCARRGWVHIFQKHAGELTFRTENELYKGMADARISICFPSSLTHPERSGGVETLTLRYLESMASRSIIVGRCPAELAELFGYNPVVEADESNATEQLDEILSNLSSFNSLVNRNLQRLREVGTWDIRVGNILDYLRQRNYLTHSNPIPGLKW